MYCVSHTYTHLHDLLCVWNTKRQRFQSFIFNEILSLCFLEHSLAMHIVSIAKQIIIVRHCGSWIYVASKPTHYGLFFYDHRADAIWHQLLNAGWLPFGNFDVQFTDHHPRSFLRLSFFFPLLH